MQVLGRRSRVLKDGPLSAPGPVVYWMSRDQRCHDNWALLYAQREALRAQRPLVVAFCLVKAFPNATLRCMDFLLRGLGAAAADLAALNIAFVLERGEAEVVLPALCDRVQASLVVCDYSPLRLARQWRTAVAALPAMPPVHEVDAHNVVPAWLASPKLEVGARTLRAKLWEAAKEFMVPFPAVVRHPHGDAAALASALDVDELLHWVTADARVGPIDWAQPGQAAGMERLKRFLTPASLKAYETLRNQPQHRAQSDLSPWLHFGHVSAQRCIMDAQALKCKDDGGFLEEIFVRRELADNYCHYNPLYDSLQGAAQWAQDTLRAHAADARTYTYTEAQLEQAQTHDQLWNAAQVELVHRGKIHGFMRMYWAKKILEWTESPAEALRIGLLLNDKYSIDGRDPNGYVGVMWSVCGAHDMGFAERPVFGKIRYMNYDGCKRKFKQHGIDSYVAYTKSLAAVPMKKEEAKEKRIKKH